MKNIKYICALLLPVLFLAVSCKEKINPNQTIKMVESMSIEPADLWIGVGSESVVSLKYMPQGAAVTGEPEWHYEGSGIELMPVADKPFQRTVKCTNLGKAKIYATLKVGDKEIRSSDCNVTMVNYKFYKFRLNEKGWLAGFVPLQEGLQLGLGEERVLIGIFNDDHSSLNVLSWKYEINSGSDVISIKGANIGNSNYVEVTGKKLGEANVTFTATTADGVTMQETVKLTINQVQVPHDYTKAEVGDIMLKDGKCLTPGNFLSEYQKDNAIGVVVLRYYSQDRVGASVRAKLGRGARGLVMALNYAGLPVDWGRWGEAIEPYFDLRRKYRDSYNGYDLTNNILSTKNLSSYPAFKQVKEYRQNHETPSMTTEWYMPSIGEWGDLLGENGIGGYKGLSSLLLDTEEGQDYRGINDGQNTVYNNLNNAFKEFSNADEFGMRPGDKYSSSTDSGSIEYHCVEFYSTVIWFSTPCKNEKTIVRCVLAF